MTFFPTPVLHTVGLSLFLENLSISPFWRSLAFCGAADPSTATRGRASSMAKSKDPVLPRVYPSVQPGRHPVALGPSPPGHFATSFLPRFSKHLTAEAQRAWKQGVWFYRNRDLTSHHPKGNGNRRDHHRLWPELRSPEHFLPPCVTGELAKP